MQMFCAKGNDIANAFPSKSSTNSSIMLVQKREKGYWYGKMSIAFILNEGLAPRPDGIKGVIMLLAW